MSAAHDKLNKILKQAGVSKTIYALVMPETEQAVDAILGDTGSSLRAAFRDMYREAWTQKQDPMHEEFFALWKQWSSPIVKANWTRFPYMYPTSGASEGLREAINSFATSRKKRGYNPIIHVFTGEYEGFAAYAAAADVLVVEHDRENWREELRYVGPHEQFYISQPSAIDGNVWPDFDEFAEKLHAAQPNAELILDLTYVGCVPNPFEIKADHPNIPAVFFSLSKPMGAYYHRIGGCLSREEYPGLFGNKWFKNLMGLRLGTEMMKRHDVYELPRKYAPVQQQAIAHANNALNLQLTPSDVYLLGTMKPPAQPTDLQRYLTRGSDGEALVRVCLTPTMAKIINPEINNTVRARPHEGLEPS